MIEEARCRLLAEWNDTTTDIPDACVHELFEAQAQRVPESIAAVFEGQSRTYRELDHRANQIAHRLRAMGIGPEVPVGIFMERSHDLLAGLLGILKAGGTYLALDPAYPQERLLMMLEDCRPPVLIAQRTLSTKLQAWDVKTLFLESAWASPDNEKLENLASGVTPNSIAYIVYTSGSTGKPKGTEISHRSALNTLISIGDKLGWTEEDTFLALSPVSYDVSVLEIFLPLITGARVFLTHPKIALIADILASHKITALQLPPFYWRLLLREGWEGTPGLKMLTGGESIHRDLARRLSRLGASLWNLYGLTELAIWSTIYRYVDGNGPVPMGRPLANTEIYILDAELQPVPIGEIGELYIGGMGLPNGYLNTPELTAQKFIPHPFSADPNARVFKTGDSARCLPDGNIEFISRRDHQLKLHGLRLEPGDIEAAMNQHPSILESAVTVKTDPSGEDVLTAFVVLRAKQFDHEELRSFLALKLPDYMIPSAFLPLNALPLTPSGKIDRKTLSTSLDPHKTLARSS